MKALIAALPCKQICCASFSTFQDAELTKPADLQNPIHPIFARENFSVNFDWDAIEMPLRLASRLLESNALVPFWNILADGELQDLDGKPTTWAELDTIDSEGQITNHKFRRCFKSGQDEVNDENGKIAKEMLELFAGMVVFGVEPDPEYKGAYTDLVRGVLYRQQAQAFPRGCRSVIRFPWETCERLSLLTRLKKALSDEDYARVVAPWDLLLDQISFAKTIVHELAHAINLASCGHRSSEPFIMDSDISEIGLELERTLFGGSVGDSHSHGLNRWLREHYCDDARERKASRFAALLELPSHALNLAYQKGPRTCFGIRNKGREYDVVWRISFAWLESLFTTKFWEEVGNESNALHPPRLGGWIFTAVPGGLMPGKHSDDGSATIKHEGVRDPQGALRK